MTQDYHVAKKNCQKYEASLEKAKNAMKSVSTMMTSILDMCAPNLGTSQTLQERVETLPEDMKNQLRVKLEATWKQALIALKVTKPKLVL